LTIRGSGFGASQGTVKLGATQAGIVKDKWSDTAISVVVPDVAAGPTTLVVTVVAGASVSVPFTASSPTIAITVFPKVIQPTGGKQQPSENLTIFESNCDDKAIDLANSPNGPYSITVTAAGIAIDTKSTPKPNKCTLTSALTIDPNAPAQDFQVMLNDNGGNPIGSANISVLDGSAGPIPPGIGPGVDVMWEVMSQKNCSDVFEAAFQRPSIAYN
jgi:hypothetical protein